MDPPHILIVEDDKLTREVLAALLRSAGYRVSCAENGAQMESALSSGSPDLVLLDICLPGRNGLELGKELRERSDAGIIFVTGQRDSENRIEGLDLGADDYVTKPFDERELLARVRALLRRLPLRPADRSRKVYRFEGWVLDDRKRLLIDATGQPVELTTAEYDLLHAMVRNPGVALTRSQLLENVSRRQWNPTDRTVDVLVSRVRRKLGKSRNGQPFIVSIRLVGYMFTGQID
jgi:two-component system torCAD operon response regulator TorR